MWIGAVRVATWKDGDCRNHGGVGLAIVLINTQGLTGKVDKEAGAFLTRGIAGAESTVRHTSCPAHNVV